MQGTYSWSGKIKYRQPLKLESLPWDPPLLMQVLTMIDLMQMTTVLHEYVNHRLIPVANARPEHAWTVSKVKDEIHLFNDHFVMLWAFWQDNLSLCNCYMI